MKPQFCPEREEMVGLTSNIPSKPSLSQKLAKGGHKTYASESHQYSVASSSRRVVHRSSSPAKHPPHFFKIILSDFIPDRKLRIPKKFVRKYGKTLSDLVFLKVPSGAVWQVELTKCDGEVWLHNGWQEFAEYYSIDHGHFLIFRYEGNSHFLVIICDMTATEIDYPINKTHHQESSLVAKLKAENMEEIENDVSIEILDDYPACQKIHSEEPNLGEELKSAKTEEIKSDVSVKILDEFPTCHKATEKTSLKEPNHGMKLRSKRAGVSHCSTQGFEGRRKFPKKESSMPADLRCPQLKFGMGKQLATASSGEAAALQRAKAFKTENPFAIVTMRPYYVSPKDNLNIPLAFAKRVFTEKYNFAILRVSDGRTWSAKCKLWRFNAKITCGWKKFVEDNDLKEADVCLFEQAKGLENTLNVVIFRAVEDGASCHRSVQKMEIC